MQLIVVTSVDPTKAYELHLVTPIMDYANCLLCSVTNASSKVFKQYTIMLLGQRSAVSCANRSQSSVHEYEFAPRELRKYATDVSCSSQTVSYQHRRFTPQTRVGVGPVIRKAYFTE